MIVAGLGFRSNAPLSALSEVLAQAIHIGPKIDLLASSEAKVQAPQLRDLAALLNLPLQGVAVEGVATPTESPRIRAECGTGSLAVAAALAAAGPGARIIVPRLISTDGTATAAIAEGPNP